MGLNLTKPKFVSPSLTRTITCHVNVTGDTSHLLSTSTKPCLVWLNFPRTCHELCSACLRLNFMQSTCCCWGQNIFSKLMLARDTESVLSRVRSPGFLLVNVPVSKLLIGPRYQVLDLCRVTSRCNLYWSPREQECPDIPRHRHGLVTRHCTLYIMLVTSVSAALFSHLVPMSLPAHY